VSAVLQVWHENLREVTVELAHHLAEFYASVLKVPHMVIHEGDKLLVAFFDGEQN